MISIEIKLCIFQQMMPHPSYVYCGKFDPDISSIVVTGCYDRIARIWIEDKKSKNWDLSQELEGHEGFINSMYFQKNSNLLTADSVGIIIIWVLKKSRKISSMKEWHISRKIKVREIDGIIINTIILHPLESRLLVHSRNNGLRMLDLATGVVLQKYNELNNQRYFLSYNFTFNDSFLSDFFYVILKYFLQNTINSLYFSMWQFDLLRWRRFIFERVEFRNRESSRKIYV